MVEVGEILLLSSQLLYSVIGKSYQHHRYCHQFYLITRESHSQPRSAYRHILRGSLGSTYLH